MLTLGSAAPATTEDDFFNRPISPPLTLLSRVKKLELIDARIRLPDSSQAIMSPPTLNRKSEFGDVGYMIVDNYFRDIGFPTDRRVRFDAFEST